MVREMSDKEPYYRDYEDELKHKRIKALSLIPIYLTHVQAGKKISFTKWVDDLNRTYFFTVEQYREA
jgi:hypothetical protein